VLSIHGNAHTPSHHCVLNYPRACTLHSTPSSHTPGTIPYCTVHAPCPFPYILTTSALRSTCARPSPSLPLRCIAPVRRPFRVALFPVRRSTAAALHSFLPSPSLLRNARMIPRLQLRSNCTIKTRQALDNPCNFIFFLQDIQSAVVVLPEAVTLNS
jgi:hypothetical protein